MPPHESGQAPAREPAEFMAALEVNPRIRIAGIFATVGVDRNSTITNKVNYAASRGLIKIVQLINADKITESYFQWRA